MAPRGTEGLKKDISYIKESEASCSARNDEAHKVLFGKLDTNMQEIKESLDSIKDKQGEHDTAIALMNTKFDDFVKNHKESDAAEKEERKAAWKNAMLMVGAISTGIASIIGAMSALLALIWGNK